MMKEKLEKIIKEITELKTEAEHNLQFYTEDYQVETAEEVYDKILDGVNSAEFEAGIKMVCERILMIVGGVR